MAAGSTAPQPPPQSPQARPPFRTTTTEKIMPAISSFHSATLNNLVDRYSSSHTVGGHSNNRSTAIDLISRANNGKTTSATYNNNVANKSIAAFNSLASCNTNNSASSSLNRTMPQPSHTIDYRQLVMSMSASGTSPRHSFQRATISSAAKTRAFNESLHQTNNPSSHHSSKSHTPSPQSTPTLLRSRSLRMSGKNQNATHYYTNSRTPELHSFNSSDISNSSHDSQVVKHLESQINELRNERKELKENCEFLERERQVLNDTLKEVEESFGNEKTQWKIEKCQLEDRVNQLIAEKTLLENKLRCENFKIYLARQPTS